MDDTESPAFSVASRQDLIVFLDQMAASVTNEPELWENDSLESFLAAWSAWLADMDGYFIGRNEAIPTAPSWTLIAQMVGAARVYE